jgi:8-oxo-dGTP diphosphatase
MKHLRFTGECAAAFIFCEGEFLISKRQGGLGSFMWGPPGGKLNSGESPEEGIVREVEEETGLLIGGLARIGYTIDQFPEEGMWFRTTWFTASSPDKNSQILEPHKSLEQRWVDLDSLPEDLFFPTQNILANSDAYELIQRAAQGLNT